MIHNFEPYFSPRGGHASCTMDFPWGHARLSEEDFSRYSETHRPHEAEWLKKLFKVHFNNPRVTLLEVEQSIAGAGLSILSWIEEFREKHYGSPSHWREVKELYPTVSLRELAIHGVHMVLVKNW